MISVFLGIETYQWTISQFKQAGDWLHTNGVDGVVVKIYERTQGEWYSAIGGPDAVIKTLQDCGLFVLPYGFFYADNVDNQISYVIQALAKYDMFCMNMESDFDNNPSAVQSYYDGLKDHKGTLYVSTWANPITHGWSKNIDILNPIVQIWMPECYSDTLVSDMYTQFNRVQGKIEPTFHVTQTNALLASIYPNFTLWEYQDAFKNPNALKTYVQLDEGKIVSYPTNKQGMIANYLPVSQFQPGHSEFECGAYAVALNQRATPYNVPNMNSTANESLYAQTLYALTTGSNLASNTFGSSVDQVHTMLKNTQSYAPPGLHWWDIESIQPGSSQVNDTTQIKAALMHGYPVIATVSETSVFDLDLGRNPYWWGASGNHIITYVGISSDGNLLVVDPANVEQGDGNLQSPKTVRAWPRRYDIIRIANQWATVVGMPWLPAIPSATPVSWPPYHPPTVNPSPPANTQVELKVLYDANSKQIMFVDGVTVVYRISL